MPGLTTSPLYHAVGGSCGPGSVQRWVWELQDSDADTRRLRTCIKKLRGKVEPDPARPRYLVCVPGFGYRLQRDSGAE